MIVYNETAWERAFGKQDLERSIATRPDTPFAVDGVTEVFTSAIVLRCIEEGQLSLDDPIGKFSPGSGDAKVTIRVPYWNSRDMATDPTHKVFFSEYSFDYFDTSTRHGKERPYYSTARFRIAAKHYYSYFWWGFPRVQLAYRKVSTPRSMRILEALARHFCGVIWVMEFDLVTLK